MANIDLVTTYSDFETELATVEQRTTHAQAWVVYKYIPPTPSFGVDHQHLFIERIFMCAFQAWEEFLEGTFTLYFLGEKPPKGNQLTPVAVVTTPEDAKRVMRRGQPYCEWSTCEKIVNLNNFIFKDPKNTYFYNLTQLQGDKLNEIAGVRNAIAHRSESSIERFKNIVRNRLNGTYPSQLTAGSFLLSIIPGSNPPETFLESYLATLRFGASYVVPM